MGGARGRRRWHFAVEAYLGVVACPIGRAVHQAAAASRQGHGSSALSAGCDGGPVAASAAATQHCFVLVSATAQSVILA